MLGQTGRGVAEALLRLARSPPTAAHAAATQCVKDVCTQLLSADVPIRVVAGMKKRITERCSELSEGSNGPQIKQIVKKVVFEELLSIVKAPQSEYTLQRGKCNVVMFVGLQGAGKTTTCTKYAQYLKRRGWRVALVCADTFRAGALDQLKQNAARIKVPFYGSYSCLDAAEVAGKGVQLFKKQKAEVIIVDTSGRHRQQEGLLDEMRSIRDIVQPDETIYVMDSHLGQSAETQILAFKENVAVGSVIITKLDGHAKGGGALVAAATVKCPISFVGTGEGFEAFEPFEAKGFVARLLGLGDPERLIRTVEEFTQGDQKDNLQRIVQGQLTFTDMQSQFKAMGSLGSVSTIMNMIPGMGGLSGLLPKDADDGAGKRFQKFICAIDSMTPDERSLRKPITNDRIAAIAHGSGTEIVEVEALMEMRQAMGKMFAKMGKGMAQARRMGMM